MTQTPPRSTVAMSSVSSELPPVAAARSTITDPGRIASIMEDVISIGAFFPGICAVVITMSARAMLAAACSNVPMVPFTSQEVAVTQVVRRGPYLDTRLKGSGFDLRFLFPANDTCREALPRNSPTLHQKTP